MKVLLGATGAINTINLPDYVRELTRGGHHVKVVLTRAAESFISTAVLNASTGVEVLTDRDFVPALVPYHVVLANWCDALVVAPMTANTLSKLALGLADNLLSTTALVQPPIVVAPCMNIRAYRHPQVRRHLSELSSRGTLVLTPSLTISASGSEALRMAGPRQLRRAIEGCPPLVGALAVDLIEGDP